MNKQKNDEYESENFALPHMTIPNKLLLNICS